MSPNPRRPSAPDLPRRGSLFAALGVSKGEERVVAPALALAFLGVGASALAAISADSLFVSTFSLGDLSRFVVFTSALRVALVGAVAALASRAAGARLEAYFFGATAAVMGATSALAHEGDGRFIYAVCAVLRLLPPLLPVVAFNAVLGCFHARQAKRLLPIVAAAATVGSMFAGVAARLLAPWLGTGSLLVLGAVLAASGAALPAVLAEAARGGEGGKQGPLPRPSEGVAPPEREAMTEPPAHEARDGARHAAAGGRVARARAHRPRLGETLGAALRDLRVTRVVRLVVGVAVFSACSVSFVDFAFKAALKASYGRDAMAAFMGSFSIASNGLVLVAQLFLASRFVRRFGVRASFTAFPVALIVVGPAFAFAPGVAVAVAAKLSEQIFRYALGGSTGDLLLTPSPAKVRTRAKILVKGVASPAGELLAGLVLSLFGEAGPGPLAMGALFSASGLAGALVVRGARSAYAEALATALGEGRVSLDIGSAGAAVLRGELRQMLTARAAAGDVAGAGRILAIMSDRFFSLADLEPAFEATARPRGDGRLLAIRRAAVHAAGNLARPAEGARLLARVPPDDDPEIEREVIRAASELGTEIPRPRLDRAVFEGSRGEEPERASLWADALTALGRQDRAAALPALRRAASGPDSPRRAAALRGLGALLDTKAEREVLRAMASDDLSVFAEAAAAAVRIEAQGAIETLVARLTRGPHVRVAAYALSLAGPRAVNQLIAALPTTRGEQALLATAVASGRSLAGTVRAARVLARLGPEGCARALARYEDLGYRARNAIARAFAAVSQKTGRAIDRGAVSHAMELTVGYAETLIAAFVTAPRGGLLRAELRHRINETGARVLDLAGAVGDRARIARARAALTRAGRAREDALELLENVLPRGLAARTVAIIDVLLADGAAPPSRGSAPRLPAAVPAALPVRFDGWLEKCAALDEGTLLSDDPMRSALEKVLILRDSSLFAGLSGEELFPVAEIAEERTIDAGEAAVREGDPGDALYVVVSGTFAVVRGETRLRELSPGAVFGELSLLDGEPRAASVIAEADGCVLRIPRAEFEALLDESPELSRGVIRTLLGHLRGRG